MSHFTGLDCITVNKKIPLMFPALKLTQSMQCTPMSQSQKAFCFKTAVRVNNHFGVSINPLIKLFIRSFGILYADFMGNNEASLCLACNNQVSQLTAVGFYITLTSTD